MVSSQSENGSRDLLEREGHAHPWIVLKLKSVGVGYCSPAKVNDVPYNEVVIAEEDDRNIPLTCTKVPNLDDPIRNVHRVLPKIDDDVLITIVIADAEDRPIQPFLLNRERPRAGGDGDLVCSNRVRKIINDSRARRDVRWIAVGPFLRHQAARHLYPVGCQQDAHVISPRTRADLPFPSRLQW